MTSEFMIAMYGSFAQAESESISKNILRGKEKAYHEGKVQFQYKYLLGYKKESDGKPEILPEEAEIVYGSNINLEQMSYRCPNSKVVGTSEIKDFVLEFRGVATIVPKKGATVPVLIWELDDRDLPTLNRYEGWPRLYRQ